MSCRFHTPHLIWSWGRYARSYSPFHPGRNWASSKPKAVIPGQLDLCSDLHSGDKHRHVAPKPIRSKEGLCQLPKGPCSQLKPGNTATSQMGPEHLPHGPRSRIHPCVPSGLRTRGRDTARGQAGEGREGRWDGGRSPCGQQARLKSPLECERSADGDRFWAVPLHVSA